MEIWSREPFRERGVHVNKPGTKQILIFKPKKLRNHPLKAAWTITQAPCNYFWVTFQEEISNLKEISILKSEVSSRRRSPWVCCPDVCCSYRIFKSRFFFKIGSFCGRNTQRELKEACTYFKTSFVANFSHCFGLEIKNWFVLGLLAHYALKWRSTWDLYFLKMGLDIFFGEPLRTSISLPIISDSLLFIVLTMMNRACWL